eukprot:scaffold6399_cov164-Chaetoceros_neogracile.AAC.2
MERISESSHGTVVNAIEWHRSSANQTIQFQQCKRICATYDLNKAIICQPALTTKSTYKACLKGSSVAFAHACLPSCSSTITGELNMNMNMNSNGDGDAGNSYQACKNYWNKSRIANANELSFCRFGYDRTYEKVVHDVVALVKDHDRDLDANRNLMGEEDEETFTVGVDMKQDASVDKDNASMMMMQDPFGSEEAGGGIESQDTTGGEDAMHPEEAILADEINIANVGNDKEFEKIKDPTVREEAWDTTFLESQDAEEGEDVLAEEINIANIGNDNEFEEIKDPTVREEAGDSTFHESQDIEEGENVLAEEINIANVRRAEEARGSTFLENHYALNPGEAMILEEEINIANVESDKEVEEMKDPTAREEAKVFTFLENQDEEEEEDATYLEKETRTEESM